MNRLTLVLLSSVMLAACGGGGGGGGGTTAGGDTSGSQNDTTDNDQEEVLEVPSQNEYLPLVENLGWKYDVQVDGVDDPSLVVAEVHSALSGQFKLKTDLPNLGGDSYMSQIYSSTPNAVSLHGIVGNNLNLPLETTLITQIGSVDVDVEITLKSITLDSGLAMVADTPSSGEVAGTMVVDVTGSVTVDALPAPIPVNQTDAEVELAITPTIEIADAANISSPWGVLVTRQVTSSIRLDGTYTVLPGYSFDVNLVVNEVADYVKGVGPVEKALSFYWDDNSSSEDGPGSLIGSVDLAIEDLIGLPLPVSYSSVGGVAVQGDFSDIRISDGSSNTTLADPNSYEILNQDNVNDLEWANVAESVNGLSYDITVTEPPVSPSSSVDTVIYISDDEGETQLPVNVTLSVAE